MRRFLLVLFCMMGLSACKSDPSSPEKVTGPQSTFLTMRSAIFEKNCESCHNNTWYALNGNFNLSTDAAYAFLIDSAAQNSGALDRGYRRVKPGHPETSFLMYKLTGDLEAGMGDRMPLNHPALTNGQIEYIRQWILAGAPKAGLVADANLLGDTTHGQRQLEPLAAPASGTGFQMHLEPFEIAPKSEREVFVYKQNPNAETKYVNRFQVRMREGSHHFILWTLDGNADMVSPNVIRENPEKEMQRGTRKFGSGSQTLDLDFSFPPGVALALPPTVGFDLNSHYVNSSDERYYGEAYMNVYTTPLSTVQHFAEPFLMADVNFIIPPHSTVTRPFYWNRVERRTHLFLLSSHAHKRMKSFKIWKGGPNGELLYSSTNWHEPLIAQLDVILETGTRLYSETVWENSGDKTLNFGFTSEDEMNVMVGYYWQE